MGNLFSAWLTRRLVSRCEHGRVIMLGLDGAGKTTILYKMKLGELTSAAPTVGFNVESIKVNNCEFTVWDVGGQEKLRPLWRHYFQSCYGLVFVVDSCARDRLDVAHREIQALLQEAGLRSAPFLILANKQDLPDALSPQYVAKHLGLFQVCNHMWRVQSASAMNGDGLRNGFEWLISNFWRGALEEPMASESVRVATIQVLEVNREDASIVCAGLSGETLATTSFRLDGTLESLGTILQEHLPSGCWHVVLPWAAPVQENESVSFTNLWFRNIAFLAQDGTPLQTKDLGVQFAAALLSKPSDIPLDREFAERDDLKAGEC